MEELRNLIASEVSDFFSGFGQIGEPTDPEEMNNELQARIASCFEHIEGSAE